MARRRRKPKPPPMCFECGRRLAWLPVGADARKPVDPANKLTLADARTLGPSEQLAAGETSGFDRHGYRMAGRRCSGPNMRYQFSGLVVEVWNYHACDPADRARSQTRKQAARGATRPGWPGPAVGGE